MAFWNKNIDYRKLFKALGLLGFLVLLLLSLGFVNHMERTRKCTAVTINIYPIDIHFLNRQRVLGLIRESQKDGKKLIGMPIGEIAINRFESDISRNPFVERAEVYADFENHLTVRVLQRKPILRLINYRGETYYMDKNGIKLPASKHFTLPVPLANGNIFERYKNSEKMYSKVGTQLYELAGYVDKDPFFKALIEQIFVRADCEFILVPKIGADKIILGDTEDLDKKFRKLKTFYSQGLSRVGWNIYSEIDLRFKGQVVGKRKK